MPDPSITDRLEDYFRRQIAWFESLLAELSNVESMLQQDDLAHATVHAKSQEETTQSLGREFTALSHEWAAASVPDADHRRIHPLAERAQALAEQLQQRYHTAAEAAHTEARKVAHEAENLRKGRTGMRKYHPQGDSDPEHMDRQA